MISSRYKKLIVQLFKFVIVGGVATIIDLVIYFVLYHYLNIYPLIANIISFSIATIYNYIASVKWVFDVNKDKNKKKIFVEFMVLCLIALLFTELLLFLFINILFINKMLSKIMSTVIVMIFNFVTRKIFLEGKSRV